MALHHASGGVMARAVWPDGPRFFLNAGDVRRRWRTVKDVTSRKKMLEGKVAIIDSLMGGAEDCWRRIAVAAVVAAVVVVAVAVTVVAAAAVAAAVVVVPGIYPTIRVNKTVSALVLRKKKMT